MLMNFSFIESYYILCYIPVTFFSFAFSYFLLCYPIFQGKNTGIRMVMLAFLYLVYMREIPTLLLVFYQLNFYALTKS